MDKFADGDIDTKTFLEYMDKKDQQNKGKKKAPAIDKSLISLKPVKDFFKSTKAK